MKLRGANLSESDYRVFRAAMAFLAGRLQERATIDWALRLKQSDRVKRLALVESFDTAEFRETQKPWSIAWRLIEECWNNPVPKRHASRGAYNIRRRLETGDRSGSLIKEIVELVRPRLVVEPIAEHHPTSRIPPKRPKTVEELISVRIGSGMPIDIEGLGLIAGGVADSVFLLSLATALDAALADGLDIARRIGSGAESQTWRLGQLLRVYHVPRSERHNGEHEPDKFHEGIAPCVKLLHTVVEMLANIDLPNATRFVRRWEVTDSPIHIRLWAAFSRDPKVSSAAVVSSKLLTMNDDRFWNRFNFPEITVLRAVRFRDFPTRDQKAITKRIRKLPPRKFWPRGKDAEHIYEDRLRWACEELRRIETTGAELPKPDKDWLDKRAGQFPELGQISRVDHGFSRTPRARNVAPSPDSQYDLLTGAERLKALEANLSYTRHGWEDRPAERAQDWMTVPGNLLCVIADLESISSPHDAFPNVWNSLGWVHSPQVSEDDSKQRDITSEGRRVLMLLDKLPESTLDKAIDGITHWLSGWKDQIRDQAETLDVWLKAWPIAVRVTNDQQTDQEDVRLDVVVGTPQDSEPMDLDTLNTPVGRLVDLFLATCPNPREVPHPFSAIDKAPRIMRDAIMTSVGRSGLICLYRLVEKLPYFLNADRDWAKENLIAPTLTDQPEAIALWRAISRGRVSSELLRIIGDTMVERAVDYRLGRETRSSLVSRLIVECLDAFHDRRELAVAREKIQQMIRSLDDEVRTNAASIVEEFVRVRSGGDDSSRTSSSSDLVFSSTVRLLLSSVWPQERSLASPGVSGAFAVLPSAVGEAFVEAVEAIERFLVPFECWSMMDYGFEDEEEGRLTLSKINSKEKAEALLRLLDLTIGTAEGSVVPHELSDALDRVREIAPNLAKTPTFRRLATAARRG